MKKQLRRSSDNVILAGICGGLAEYFDIDPTLVRIGYILLSSFSAGFPGVFLYLVLLLIMPK